jgi:hypothetical protein
LRKPDGSAFAVAQLDDFEVEVELLRNNPDFRPGSKPTFPG